MARKSCIFGQPVPVRAKICTVGGLSAHADQPTLLNWLAGFHKQPGQACVVHSEASASEAFIGAIKDGFGWKSARPKRGEFIEL